MSTADFDTDLMRSVVAAMPDGPLRLLREEAVDRFSEIGFPTVGDEDWKYTNLSEAVELSNAWLASISESGMPHPVGTLSAIDAVRQDIDADWIVLCDGRVHELAPTIEGVEISRIDDSNTPADLGNDPMTLFNAALLQDGVHVRINRGCKIDRPIGLLFVDSPSNSVSQTRVSIDVEDNADVKVIEVLLSTDEGPQFTNAVTNIRVAGGACVNHVRIQSRTREHTGVARIPVRLERDAQYHHNSFDFGGATTRTDLVADICGAGADVSMNGLYLASGNQHIDNHTLVTHKVGPARSREEYRGILAGRSQCVFNGKVVVEEGADGTDSGQSNHNLLLSDLAEIDTKPELEIYADDVKCAHGATVGQLDETALFYLRSRGIDPDAARQMITRAFAAETLGTLCVEACRDYLETLLDARLQELVGTGDD